MTSGGDTSNDSIHACKPSAKNHEENLNTVLRPKPLKNHRLQIPLSGPARGHIFPSVQFSAVFAPSFSNCVLRKSARPEPREDGAFSQVLLD
jgi:hypothetical protein